MRVRSTTRPTRQHVQPDPGCMLFRASESVPAARSPHLSLTKAATETSFSAAGVTLHYTLEATNDGNVTLTDVSITDAKLGTLDCTPSQGATLEPSETLSCTGTYLTTQADVDAGKVDNTANAGRYVWGDPGCCSSGQRSRCLQHGTRT